MVSPGPAYVRCIFTPKVWVELSTESENSTDLKNTNFYKLLLLKESISMLTEQELDFLKSLSVTEETATLAQLSEAKSYASCYRWYIENQKVLPENAALASKVWVQKYCLKNELGICLEKTPEDMWHRIAKTLARVEMETNKKNTKTEEEWEEIFYDNQADFKGVPGGSALSVLGNDYINSSCSNCFVVGTEDSLEGIMKTASEMARLQSYRGGTGIDISPLRPAGSIVHNSARFSTGAVSFMDFFSKVTATIGQTGRSGATMISIDSHHPDIEGFIEEKQDLDKAWFFDELRESDIDINDWEHTSIATRLKSTSKANVSVKAYDAFMRAVEKDTDYELWYEFKDNKYPRISKIVRARDLWNKFIKANVTSAEPGILFWDTIIRESVSDCYAGNKKYTVTINDEVINYEHDVTTCSTNPCSELPLPKDSACTLLSQNLTRYIINPWLGNSKFDWNSFEADIRISTRMLDNIKEYDISRLPLLGNKVDATLCRRIGLGCHGLADALASLGLKYDTEEAIHTADKIYKVLANTVYDESVNLGIEKGTFQIWDWELEKNNPFLNRLDVNVLSRIKQYGRRNIACLTNAPTGSISILSRNCSSGIEPVFKLKYLRNVKKQGSEETNQYIVFHQAAQDCLIATGNVSDVFIEANDINWEKRIEMQSALQLSIDHSISSTLNLPEGTTEETASNIYLAAWRAGLKGATLYVEGSRSGVLVSSEKKVTKTKFPIERPKSTNIDIHKVKYKEQSWCVLVGKTEDDKPIEVFAGIESDTPLPNKYHRAELVKRSRGQYALTVWLSPEEEDDVIKISNIGARFPLPEGMALTRFISMSLRNGISVSDISEQLIKSSNSLFSYPNVLNRVLKLYISDEEVITKEKAKGKKCPECGELLEFKRESGCLTEICSSCSYSNSKCG